MTKSGPTQRRPIGARGVKALITAASVTATLGGWAALTHAPTGTASSPPALALAPLQPVADLPLEPLPTIVPPPQIVIDRLPTLPAALIGGQAPTVDAAPPMVQQDVAAPPLRVVSAAPRPVARTRSSR